MDIFFEFLIPRKPKSVQSKEKRGWTDFVAHHAKEAWGNNPPVLEQDLHLTLIWLYSTWSSQNSADVDNIIKPIQDALKEVVYGDDCCVVDVESHRRSFGEISDLIALPDVLIEAIQQEKECVYVQISNPLETGELFL